MSTSSHRIRSRRPFTHGLGIAAALFAAVGLAPAVAAAEDAASTQLTAVGQLASVNDAGIVVRRSAEPDLRLSVDKGTSVAMDGEKASITDLQQGAPVRASYEEANGVARATKIEAKRGPERSNVTTMSLDDPEWDVAHSGG